MTSIRKHIRNLTDSTGLTAPSLERSMAAIAAELRTLRHMCESAFEHFEIPMPVPKNVAEAAERDKDEYVPYDENTAAMEAALDITRKKMQGTFDPDRDIDWEPHE